MHGAPDILPQDLNLTWAILTGACIAAQCALLSVLVVLKRMAFIGQGISHAALGGVGVAAILGITQGPLYFVIVFAACIAAALLVGWLRDRRAIDADTAIGIVLVASMSLGIVLLGFAERQAEAHDHAAHDHAHEIAEHADHAAHAHDWEALLFGSIAGVDLLDTIIAAALLLITIAVALRFGRSVLFWAFDERAAGAFGAPTTAAQFGLMVALAATIVASMKLVGVILATALLVLPGAIALRCSRRLPPVLAISIASALASLALGLAAASITGVPVGGAVVLALVLGYAASWPMTRRAQAPADPQPSPQRITT